MYLLEVGSKDRYCEECYNELAHGIISLEPARIFSSSAHLDDDDESPEQQNGIRAMEDCSDDE